MNNLHREEFQHHVHKLLKMMLENKASDLFITADFPPAMKIGGKLVPLKSPPLTAEQSRKMVHAITNDKQWQEYQEKKGANFAIAPEGIGRFRVNAFTQQHKSGMVIRVITTEIPDFDKMGLPEKLREVVMEKRGLILLVGGTGSGKSTTLAAMIDQRNQNTHGHIITIEDPVEYVHPHKNCIITHREVGIDTVGWFDALKDTLRQAPDVILIGEIRDAETMEYALNFAETGHLAMATLHANNANQAIERIVSFFETEKHEKVRNELSFNLRAIISQRLVRKEGGGRAAAIEILLQSQTANEAITKGDIGHLKTIMAKSNEMGMKTFDQALYDLYEAGTISLQEAEMNADGKSEFKLLLKLNSERFRKEQLGGEAGHSISKLSFDGQKEMEAAKLKAAEEAAKEPT